MNPIVLTPTDALLVVDVQNDFLPGGSLAVKDGDAVIAFLNRAIAVFVRHGLAVYATRDWHPPAHCSFLEQGGIWPPHCVAGSYGAQFPAALQLPGGTVVVSKATSQDQDAYSGFGGGELERLLRAHGTGRVFIGGLTTDYCVLNSVRDAVALGLAVMLLTEAIRAVDVKPGDGQAAVDEMLRLGAVPVRIDELESAVMRPTGPH